MKNNQIIAGLFIASVLFLAGCAGTEPPAEVTSNDTENVTTTLFLTTTSFAQPTSTAAIGTSTSSISTTSTTKSLPPLPASINDSECYAKKYFWCAGRCSRTECAECRNYMRCVMVNESNESRAKVETAEQVPFHEGSCEFLGAYTNAGGMESYCDIHEGTMIYAKCGVDAPSPLDCYKLSGGTQSNRAAYTKRSFHSNLGAEYDLWCFRCDVVS
jgi:hypothetical protein